MCPKLDGTPFNWEGFPGEDIDKFTKPQLFQFYEEAKKEIQKEYKQNAPSNAREDWLKEQLENLRNTILVYYMGAEVSPTSKKAEKAAGKTTKKGKVPSVEDMMDAAKGKGSTTPEPQLAAQMEKIVDEFLGEDQKKQKLVRTEALRVLAKDRSKMLKELEELKPPPLDQLRLHQKKRS